jgi:tripartite-type tricarboxylate transporter receptor subunit TctC
MKRLLATLVCAGVGYAATAPAQVYPTRPITMIVPASAGGPTDSIARTFTERMGASLGKNVIIENVGGASGTIGTGRVERAAPDGYTIGIGGWNHYVVNGAIYQLPYDFLRDFEPISQIATGPMLILSRKTVAANDLQEFMAWLKAHPDNLSFGTGGLGSPPHISGLSFEKAAGAHFQFVPYRGTAPAMQDLVAGHIDLMFDQASAALAAIQGGNVKAYAVTAKARLASAPDIPTVDEAGLPGFYVSVWHGMWAPKGTPNEIIAKLNAAVVDALADPTVRKRLGEIGQELPPREQQTPAALAAFHRSEIEKWWPVIRAAGIKPE